MVKNGNYSPLRVPVHLNLPWLTERYVYEHAFFLVPDFVFDESYSMNHPEWGDVPCRSRVELHEGDVIIFDSYSSWEKDGIFHTDRFHVLDRANLEDFINQDSPNLKKPVETKEQLISRLSQRTDLLPIGVVVHSPEYYLLTK